MGCVPILSLGLRIMESSIVEWNLRRMNGDEFFPTSSFSGILVRRKGDHTRLTGFIIWRNFKISPHSTGLKEREGLRLFATSIIVVDMRHMMGLVKDLN